MRFLSRIVNAVCESMAWAAVIIVVSERYLGRDVRPAQAIALVWTRVWAVFWTNVVFWVMVYVGLILLIVPGLYLFAKYFAMMPVVVLERADVGDALRRSAVLTNGAKWRAFVLVALPWVLYLWAFGIITTIVRTYTSGITTVVFTRLLIAAVYPFLGIVATFLYYDLRFRNEGLDLDLMLAAEQAHSAPA